MLLEIRTPLPGATNSIELGQPPLPTQGEAASRLGPDARILFPVATAVGALLLLASDVLSKVVLYPREIPVGLCTTLLAAPMILLLLRHSNLGLNR